MTYKPGDKFVLELHKPLNEEQTLWQIKGFNALVFDTYGLEILTPLDHYIKKTRDESFNAYMRGKKEGREELANRIVNKLLE